MHIVITNICWLCLKCFPLASLLEPQSMRFPLKLSMKATASEAPSRPLIWKQTKIDRSKHQQACGPLWHSWRVLCQNFWFKKKKRQKGRKAWAILQMAYWSHGPVLLNSVLDISDVQVGIGKRSWPLSWSRGDSSHPESCLNISGLQHSKTRQEEQSGRLYKTNCQK